MAYRWFTKENVERSISGLLHDAAMKRKDDPAMRYFGKTISYLDLWKYATKTSLFVASWTAPDDRVALFLPNIPQFVFAYYGTLMAGRIAAPINFMSIASELRKKKLTDIQISREIVAQFLTSRPSLVFVADMFYPVFSQIPIDWPCKVVVASPAEFLPSHLKPFFALKMLRKNGCIHFAPKHIGYFLDVISEWPSIEASHAYDSLDRVAQIQFTGGTTGTPKGAVLTHRNLVTNMWQARERLGDLLYDGEEVVLGALPFFHIYGLTACMNITFLALRGTLILMPSFDAKEAIRNIGRYGVTVFPGVERMYDAMLREKKMLAKTDVSSLKLCVSGAGSLSKRVADEFRMATGTAIVEGYGMSEASPVVSLTMPEDAYRPAPERGNLIGLPVPRTTITIRDDNEAEVPTGEVGRIFVSGPQVMQGYFRNEEETNKVLQNGVLKTPDYGYKDEKGHIYFTDREMIKILGENVYPANIERVILTHPAVAEVAVIGVPHLKAQETVVAVVVWKKHVYHVYPIPSEREIALYVNERLSDLEVPSRVIFMESLDEFKTPIGKILKRKLKEHIMQELKKEKKQTL